MAKTDNKFDYSGAFASFFSGTAILSFPLVINLCSPLDNNYNPYCAQLEQKINQDLGSSKTGYISVNCDQVSPRYYFRDSHGDIVDEGHNVTVSGYGIVTDGGDVYHLINNTWKKSD
ncbi:MAG: hypothetical protein Q8R37_02140 [Nanoarchaeota archaeon]|nr:hypothetical protein [Nanoarchaeota archaeon]